MKKIIKKIKDNYNYYKMGVKDEMMTDKTRRAKENIKNVMNTNSEMGQRMEEEFKKYQKQGIYKSDAEMQWDDLVKRSKKKK